MKKIDLTTTFQALTPQIVNGQVQRLEDGTAIQEKTNVPLSSAIIPMLDYSVTFDEAIRKAALLEKVNTQKPFDATEEEFTLLCGIAKNLTTVPKAAFASMIENLNKGFKFKEYEVSPTEQSF